MADDEQPRKRVKLSEPQANGNGSKLPQDQSQLEKELKSGITAYTAPNVAGFSGILKQRYTDFLVNEIRPNGETLHLINPDVVAAPEEEKSIPVEAEPKVETTEIAKEQAAPAPTEATESNGTEGKDTTISAEDQQKIEDIFGPETTKKVLKLYRQVLDKPNKRRRDFDDVTSDRIDDREKRTSAHQLIRKVFTSNIETTTGAENAIVFSANPQRSQNGKAQWAARNAGPSRSKGKLGWDELGGEHCHFTLYKENKDTMEIMFFLASVTKQHIKNFQFAGTKDRRGVTVQRCSAYRMQAERLAGLNRQLRNAKIGDYKYEQQALTLGELGGNEFCITLRDCEFSGQDGLNDAQTVEAAQKIVGQAVENLQTNGFINYFGLQRFGSFAISTDQIGKKLLQEDLQGAIDLILHVDPVILAAAQDADNAPTTISSDDRRRALAISDWRAGGNTKKALDNLPRKFSAEIAIIRHLGAERNGHRHNEKDFLGAFMGLQRNLRLMYVHAYQSLVWNNAAGKRLELFGHKVVEGDLVIIDNNDSTPQAGQERDENGEVIIQPQEEDKAADADEDYTRARPLSKEEAESGKFTVFDLVLPLPGFDVIYPTNEVGRFYEEFMASDQGGNLDPHKMRRGQKDISLSGGYRKILAKPGDGMSFEVREYTDDTAQMVETDLDILKRNNPGRGQRNGGPQGKDVEMRDGEAEVGAESKLAVILKMKLGSSQYATMALRELMKEGGCKSFAADFGTAK